MLTSTITFFVLLAQGQIATPAAEAERKAEAQALLHEGTATFERGDFAGALKKFEEAHATYPSPKILFNIASAERNLGRNLDALNAFERFLKEAPDAPEDARIAARQAVASIGALAGKLRISCEPPGAQIFVDGNFVGAAPLGKDLWVSPREHRISSVLPGYSSLEQSIQIRQGDVAIVALALNPVPPKLDWTPPPRPIASESLGASVAGESKADINKSRGSSGVALDSIVHKRWFWPLVGGVVLVGTIAVLAATSGGATEIPKTDLGAQTVFR